MSGDKAIVPTRNDWVEHAISRRSLIKVAVGSIAALPFVSGGLGLPFDPGVELPFGPEEAYALDIQVVIAKYDEIAIVVMDMTSEKRTPLGDARVRVTSNFNHKTVEGITDSRGKVIFNITDLAEDEGKKASPVRYEFQAQVEISKEGYRTFRTGRMYLRGGHGIAAPTRKLERGVPYPARVTFDDWDVLYTGNEFVISPKNDMRHEMRIDLANLTSSSSVKVMLYADDREIASTSATPSNGSCTATLREHFLMTKAAKVLPAGASYSIRYSQDGTTYSAPLSFKTMAAVGGFEAPGVNRNFSLSPFSEAKSGGTSHKGLSVTIPKGCPLVGGQKLQLWKPEFTNLDFGFDPFGFAYISFKTTDRGFKEKNGKVVGSAWQEHPKESFAAQYDKVLDDAAGSMVKTLNAVDKWSGIGSHVDFTQAFSATVAAQISLAAKWGEKQEGLFRVRAGGQIILSLDFSLAWQFLAGPVPMVFQFSINTNFTLGLSIAASTTKLFEWSDYQLDYTNSALSFTLDFSPSISLGVGIKGALSVSVKGVLTITLFTAMTVLPDDRPKDVENPHKVVGINAATFVVIQFFFFTIPFALPFKMNKPAYYDSWKGGYSDDYTAQGLTAQSDDQASTSFEELIVQGLESGEGYILQEEDFADLAEVSYDFDIGETDEDDSGQVEEGFELKEDYYTIGEYDEILKLTEVEIGAQDAIDTTYFYEGATPVRKPRVMTLQSTRKGRSLKADSSSVLADRGHVTAAAPPQPPSFTPTDERVYLNKGHSVVEQKVGGIASRTGLVPKATEIFATNVIGDPRIKVFSIFGYEFIFRIGTANVGQPDEERKPVTRIMCEGAFGDGQRYNYVFDYDARGQRINRHHYFDYDYDVYVQEDGDVANLHFFVISGRRDSDTSQSLNAIGTMACNQVVTYVHYQISKATKKAACVTSYGLSAQKAILAAATSDEESEFEYHNISCPHIDFIEDTVVEDGAATTRTAFVMTYLDRAAKVPTKVFSQKEDEVRVGFGMFFYDVANKRLTFSSTAAINEKVFGEIQDYSVFEVELFERSNSDARRGVGWHVAMLKGGQVTYYFLVELGACGAYHNNYGWIPGAYRDQQFIGAYRDELESNFTLEELSGGMEFGPSRLVRWPNHDGFLASVKGRLVHVTLEDWTLQSESSYAKRVPKPHFVYRECGPDNFSVSAFGVDGSGRFLYYPAVREGVPGYTYDEFGNGTARKEVDEHDVMACKLYGDTFSDPFVFCEVDYDMDTLVALSPQKSVAMSFLSTNLIDTRKSKGEIRYTAMPYVRCANVIGCASPSEYSFPGLPSPFNITIRNDGNVHLAGCTIRLHKRGASRSDSDTLTKLVFSKDTLIESNYNPAGGDGALQGVAPDYSLAPGKTSVYQIDLPIPADWSGTTSASVTAEAFIAAEGSGGASAQLLAAQAVDGLAAQAAGGLAAQADELASQETDGEGNVYVDYVVSESDYVDDDYGYEYPYDDVNVLCSSDIAGVELEDAPVEERGDIADDDGSGSATTRPAAANTHATPKNTQTTSKDAQTTPKTGDSLGGLNGVFMAAAAAGAAMVAYSARRAANERAAAAAADGNDVDADQPYTHDDLANGLVDGSELD